MLHLPDVAELVDEQIVRRVTAAQQDRLVERVPVEAAKPREAKEPRRLDDPDPLDRYGARIPVELVEPRLRSAQCSGEISVQTPGGWRSITASWPPMSWYRKR